MNLEIAFWMSFGFVAIEASAIYAYCHFAGLIWHPVKRSSPHNLRIPLLPAQIMENEEIREMGLFALIHFSLWMIIFLFSFYFIENWLDFLYYGPEGNSVFGSLGFWVLNLLIPTIAIIKKVAYPKSNMKPIYWFLICSLFLLLAFALRPQSASAENIVAEEVIPFAQPTGFPKIVEVSGQANIPTTSGWDYRCEPEGSENRINTIIFNNGAFHVSGNGRVKVWAICKYPTATNQNSYHHSTLCPLLHPELAQR